MIWAFIRGVVCTISNGLQATTSARSLILQFTYDTFSAEPAAAAIPNSNGFPDGYKCTGYVLTMMQQHHQIASIKPWQSQVKSFGTTLSGWAREAGRNSYIDLMDKTMARVRMEEHRSMVRGISERHQSREIAERAAGQ